MISLFFPTVEGETNGGGGVGGDGGGNVYDDESFCQGSHSAGALVYSSTMSSLTNLVVVVW